MRKKQVGEGNWNDRSSDFKMQAPQANEKNFHQRFDRYGRLFGDRTSTKGREVEARKHQRDKTNTDRSSHRPYGEERNPTHISHHHNFSGDLRQTLQTREKERRRNKSPRQI